MDLVACNQSVKQNSYVCYSYLLSIWKSISLATLYIGVSSVNGCSKNLLRLRSVNVSAGELEDRQMLTGMHTVADIFCIGCGSIVGWKYVRFFSVFQEYDFSCLYLELSYPIRSFRRLLMKKVRSTKKENLFLNG